jgi:hypothetical protein
LGVLNAQLLKKGETPVIPKKKEQPKPKVEQKKQNQNEFRFEDHKKELSQDNFKKLDITRTRT